MASHPITTCSGSEGDKAVMSSLCGYLVCNSDESGFITHINYLLGLSLGLKVKWPVIPSQPVLGVKGTRL